MTVKPPLTPEQRTAAFQARMRNKAPRVRVSLAQRLKELVTIKHRGRRLAALAVAVGVPAMAAPGQWEQLRGDQALTEEVAVIESMPFETAGQSFPGSAFYYLEDSPRMVAGLEERDLALFDMSGTGGTEEVELATPEKAGPAARSFTLFGGGLDKARALQCMTNAIYYEAASEADAGQRAVAQVVLNRVAHPSYPNSVCGVVFQGSERRTGCQFSFTCDGSMKRKPGAGAWARAQRIAQDALSGSVFEPVGLATHYHTVWIYPYWAPSLDHIGTIGAHRFYRWKGSAGQPAAFRARYAGNEPAAAAKPRSASAEESTAAADPLALAKAFEEGRLKALAEAEKQASPAPRAPAPRYSADVEKRGGDELYTAENLPSSGTVKPEYANSGRWIAEPK